MSCHVFFSPSRFNTLSFIENCRETWDINQAINSRDYANEVTGGIVSQNSFSPGRLRWTLPRSAIHAWIESHHTPGAVLLKGHPAGQRRHREDFLSQTGSQGQQFPGRLQRRKKMCEPQIKGRCEATEMGLGCQCGRDSYSGGNRRK